MEGLEMNGNTAKEKINVFLQKLPIWINRIDKQIFANFLLLEEALICNTEKDFIVLEIKEYLKMLIKSFDGYFAAGEIEISEKWILDPFIFNMVTMDDINLLKNDLIELRRNGHNQMEFQSMSLQNFWCAQLLTFPRLAKIALRHLVPFATTYLCEMGFSSLVHIKTKARNRLNAIDDMCVAVAKTKPRTLRLIEEKQQQPSH